MQKREKVTIGHLWGAFYPALLYLGMMMVASTIFAFIGVMQGKIVVEHGNINYEAAGNNFFLLVTFFAALMTIPLLILIKYLDIKKQRMIGAYGYKSVFFAKYLLIIPFAVTFMYAGNILVTMLEKLFPFIAHTYDETAQIIFGADVWLQVLTAVLLGPIVEELIFRGLMYIRLKRMFGSGIAAFVTGLIFGVYHWNLAQGIYAFLFSYATIFIYEKYKNIYAPIIMHIAANATSILVTFALKDYNTSSGSMDADTLNQTPWSSLIFVLVFSGVLCMLFALSIYKWVNPKKK